MPTPDQRAIIRMRYIARNQLGTLYLHPDLCLKVLNDYGCNVVDMPQRADGIEATWPTLNSPRSFYSIDVLPRMAERILLQTAQDDAQHAARALTTHAELLCVCEAAEHALRSYEHGNSAPDLAREVADHLHATIAKARGLG